MQQVSIALDELNLRKVKDDPPVGIDSCHLDYGA